MSELRSKATWRTKTAVPLLILALGASYWGTAVQPESDDGAALESILRSQDKLLDKLPALTEEGRSKLLMNQELISLVALRVEEARAKGHIATRFAIVFCLIGLILILSDLGMKKPQARNHESGGEV